MKKQLYRRIVERCYQLGKDVDGDIIYYRGKTYHINILHHKIREVTDFPEIVDLYSKRGNI